MTGFRLLLIFFFVVIAAYTAVTMANYGTNFLNVAISLALSGTWPGQFAVDFSMYLILSALWIAWRGDFGPASLLMAAVAGVLGMLVFAPYLIWCLHKSKGDIRQFLLGVHTRTRAPISA